MLESHWPLKLFSSALLGLEDWRRFLRAFRIIRVGAYYQHKPDNRYDWLPNTSCKEGALQPVQGSQSFNSWGQGLEIMVGLGLLITLPIWIPQVVNVQLSSWWGGREVSNGNPHQPDSTYVKYRNRLSIE